MEYGVIPRAVQKMTELDAAGWGIVVLRCDSEADIRRTVRGYIHSRAYTPKNRCQDWRESLESAPPVNLKEVTGLETVKTLTVPFSWWEHGPREGDTGKLDYGAEPALMHFLIQCAHPDEGLEHRLLYVPRLADLIGGEGGERTGIQLQYLYLLREIGAQKRVGRNNTLIVVGCTDGVLCRDLREYSYVLDIDCPEKQELLGIIREACRACAGPVSGLEPAVANELAEALRGMRRDDVNAIFSLAYARSENPLEYHAKSLFQAAKEAKRQRIAGVRGLKWVDTDAATRVGGLDALQAWLKGKRKTFLFPHAAALQRAAAPKGVLFAGLPGCGKTHLAKYTARIMSSSQTSIPLLQMDLGSMLGKWLGEAEANCSMALRAVESVAPCVLLVDEIEKMFGGVTDEGANDALMHIFSAFLEWMQQEREKPILVIATANRTSRLPPELQRKGRFDETFFTGIPTRQDCVDILKIHLEKKGFVLEDAIDLESVAASFLGCAASLRRFLNGADIETIVNAAFCRLFNQLSDQSIADAEADRVQPWRYTQEEVSRALEQELKVTRSYFDSNLQNTARYWLEMYALDFRESGSRPLLDREMFDPATGHFRGLDPALEKRGYLREIVRLAEEAARAGDYDRALRFTLAGEICRVAKERGES